MMDWYDCMIHLPNPSLNVVWSKSLNLLWHILYNNKTSTFYSFVDRIVKHNIIHRAQNIFLSIDICISPIKFVIVNCVAWAIDEGLISLKTEIAFPHEPHIFFFVTLLASVFTDHGKSNAGIYATTRLF